MKLFEQGIYWSAAAGIRMTRFLLPLLSDRAVGRLLRLAERMVYIAAGETDLAASIAEGADVFESGPPFSTSVRKILAGMETDIAGSILVNQIKPSPYGTR
jgi:hypothetical protein